MSLPRPVLLLLAALSPSAVVRAQVQEPIAPHAHAQRHHKTLTGSWGGARTKLEEELGLTILASVTMDASQVVSGGVARREAIRALFDVNASLDLGTFCDLQGGTLFVDAYGVRGRDGSQDSGDVQVYSNIDAPELTVLAEAWYDQWLWQRRARFRVGKIDANEDFARVGAANDFLHSSAGFSPTIFTLPTFPDPAVGVNLFVEPVESLRVGVGAFNAGTGRVVSAERAFDVGFDEVFLVGEVAWTPDNRSRVAVGAWHHTGDFPRFDGGTGEGARGFYALAETPIWVDDPRRDDSRSVTAFVQFGQADRRVSDVARHLAAGFQWQGPLARRAEDRLGVYVSHVELSRQAGFGGDETALEVFYLLQLTPYLFVQPDLQLIVDPSGRSDIDDAVVATLRVQVTF